LTNNDQRKDLPVQDFFSGLLPHVGALLDFDIAFTIKDYDGQRKLPYAFLRDLGELALELLFLLKKTERSVDYVDIDIDNDASGLVLHFSFSSVDLLAHSTALSENPKIDFILRKFRGRFSENKSLERHQLSFNFLTAIQSNAKSNSSYEA
jgi:hypothetical protein